MTISYAHWKQVPRTWEAWPWRHFIPKEIACKGTGKLSVNAGLLDKLDLLRSRLGHPLSVSSVFFVVPITTLKWVGHLGRCIYSVLQRIFKLLVRTRT